ncbi:UNVERIFIED_CONTAM: hypothetical protein GTU68_046757 [Idotea baltica]|nr:hypothetical protein [Idotea baltica]
MSTMRFDGFENWLSTLASNVKCENENTTKRRVTSVAVRNVVLKCEFEAHSASHRLAASLAAAG